MNDNPAVFSNIDSTVKDYRAFSPVAFAAFVVALIAGTIAMVNASWVLMAFVSVVWSIATLVMLHVIGKGHAGLGLATAALFISLFTAAAPITYRQCRFSYMTQTAIRHANTWLALVQEGKTHEPYQLTLSLVRRQKPGVRLESHYGTNEAPTADFSIYLNCEPEKTIREDGKGCKLVRLPNLMYDHSGPKREDFFIPYELKRKDPSLPSRFFRIQMRRQVHLEPYGVQWIAEWVINDNPNIPRTATQEKMSML